MRASSQWSLWRSLRARVTLLTLAIFLGGIWSLAFLTQQSLRNDLQRMLGEQQFAAANLAATEIEQDLRERLQWLARTAEDVTPATLEDAASAQIFLKGSPFLQTLFSGGTYIAGSDGTAVASLPLSLPRVGVNYMNRDSVAAALKEGKTTVGQLVVGKVLKGAVFSMAAPIRNAHGEVIGVLVGVTDMRKPNFLDRIVDNHYGKTGSYFLVEPKSRLIVTSSDKARAMQALPAPGAVPALDRFVAGYDGYSVYVNQNGVEQLGSARRLAAADWGIFVSISTAEAFAPVDEMQRRMLLGTAILTLLLSGLIWYMLRRQLAPMLLASTTLSSWSKSGQQPQPLPIAKEDEVGQLIGSFNELLVRQGLQTQRAQALLALPEAAESLDERSFMQHGLDLAEQLTASQIGFIHFVNDDQNGIELVTWSRKTLAHYCTATFDAHYPVSQAGIWADALRQRAPVVVNDYARAADKRGLPEGHASLDRFVSVPVIQGGLVRMMAGVGNKPAPYSDFDLETVRLITDKMWHIVSQRRAAVALRQSEAHSRAITQSAVDAIITSDSAGNIVGWNKGATTIFGYAESEAMGQPMTLIIPERFQQGHLAGMNRMRENGEQHLIGKTVEIAGKRKNGTEFPVELALNKWAGGNGWFVSGILRDITERKTQQARLNLSAQVFAQSREGITLTDLQGTILMVNPAFSGVTGYDAAEAIGQNPRILRSGRQDASFYTAMWDQIRTVGHWSGEIWNRNKNGTIYPEWLSISTLRDEHGVATNYMASFNDLSATKAAENQIVWLSHFDTVTGLPNRTLLQDRAAQALSMVQRAGEPLTVMVVSIDHFTAVTDSLGFQGADDLLREIGHRLGDCVRDQDTVARLGGKDFVLMLPGTGPNGAAHLAKEVLSRLAKPYHLKTTELNLTSSLGLACYPRDATGFDALLEAAQVAMHRAKDNESGSYQFFSNDMHLDVRAHEQLVQALHHAIELEQLHVLYQPQVDLQTGKICGLEALLRWTHPQLGAVPPTKFIPIAEGSGLIIAIGEWVLRRACRDIRAWLDQGVQVPHVAVNVSPLQFHGRDFTGRVNSALTEWQVAPALIYLEVTEGALMSDVTRSEAMLKELKALGLKLSLGDFGTGYSSLSYLKRFPFDQVKIDQSFVRDITNNTNDPMMVKVIVSMAHGLGMKVVAEGVETEAQCEILRTCICDGIQGYIFSQPVPRPAIEELYREGRQLPSHLLYQKTPQRTLLLVDDEPNIVSALKRLFRRDGHLILTASSGAEGLEVLAKHKVDVIISDQRMPGMTGVEFLRTAKANYPDTIRIVLSGYTELQSVTDAINEGAVYRFLTKPWEDEPLREQIQKALEYKNILEENRQFDIKIQSANQELVAANRQLGDVLQQNRAQSDRNENSLSIAREALELIPITVLGVDPLGVIVFANHVAQELFASHGPLLETELTHTIPEIHTAMVGTRQDGDCAVSIKGHQYHAQWRSMGENSKSRGKLITLSKVNSPSKDDFQAFDHTHDAINPR